MYNLCIEPRRMFVLVDKYLLIINYRIVICLLDKIDKKSLLTTITTQMS